MKGYRNFIIVFIALFVLYVIAELNKPKKIDWTITLSRKDKNPFGGYILYNQLKDLFPDALLQAYQRPPYNQLNNSSDENSAYIIISPQFEPGKNDYEELMNYVSLGNYVFVSSDNIGKSFLDSFGLKTDMRITFANKDSTSVNFVNPLLKANQPFTFLRSTIDQYFSAIDTAHTVVLGVNDQKQPNYVKVEIGEGAFFIHSAPLCFSNYFMLFANNARYTASALSYLPRSVKKIYWDEYKKLKSDQPTTPLRFFLSNEYLKWALRISIAGLLLYVLFQMKRRQRIIPTILPLKNSTLDFVKTVSNVYFNQKDNNSLAHKKVTYFLDHIRQRFFLPTQKLDEEFTSQLARKSGVAANEVASLVQLLNEVETGYPVSDRMLIKLDQQIDKFYKNIA